MTALFQAQLLDTWEQGARQPFCKRALMLLALACPDEKEQTLYLLPIGRRDTRLLFLRETLFGSTMENLVACPVCAEQLEFSCTVSDLSAPVEGNGEELYTIVEGDVEIKFRLPNSHDVMAAISRKEIDSEHFILERCIVAAHRGSEPVTISQLDDALVTALVEAMDRADPQGNMQLDMSCPACAHRWQSPFDITSYLWMELEEWARRTLREVHILASAYGWNEASILAMSSWRRHFYLDLVLQ